MVEILAFRILLQDLLEVCMDIHKVSGVLDLLVDVGASHGVLSNFVVIQCIYSLVHHFNVFSFTIITVRVQIFSNWWFQSIGILS